MADKLHDLDDEKLKKMEKKISAIYKRAEKEVKATAEDFLKEFDKEDKKRAKEVLQGKETHDNYIAWREEQILRSKKYKEMQENIALQLSHTNEMAVAYVNGEMPPIYIANYNDLSNVVDGIGGYSFDLIDQNVLNELINENPTLLPERELDIPKDLKWNRKKIQSELLQGIIQGEPMDKIAKRMGRITDMNKHSAIRNARTSVTNVENKGRMDSYIKAEKDGIILNKEWIATAGNRTRDSHARLNGTVIPYDQKFDNGLMYPADPNGRPEEVYNCRCTMGATVVGFKQRMQVKDDLTEQTVVNNGVAQKVLTRNIEQVRNPIQIDGISQKLNGSLNKRFKELDERFHANVKDIQEMLKFEQTEYDIRFNNYVKHLLDENPKMRKSTAEKRTKLLLGERPERTDILLGGTYTPDDKLILLNRRNARSRYSFEESKKIRKEYFQRQKQRAEEGRRIRSLGNVSDGIEGTFIHEYGHAIDDTYGVATDKRFVAFYNTLKKEDIEFGISSYATTNEKEFIAESFAESFYEDQRPISKEFMKILEEIINDKLK